MTLAVVLAIAAALLIVSALSLALLGTALGRILVYGISLTLAGIGLAAALGALIGQVPTETLTLPLGLPWIGAHFRLDALSAFFLVVVNLGGGAASLYALGFGRHETAPQRVLPFYPLFLAGMTLVVIADDAFTFLFSWEFMSLSSWALVMAHDHVRENLRAGYVYLVMASFGTLALLIAFGLLAGPDGAYAFDAIRNSQVAPGLVPLVLILVLIGTGSKAGLVPLHAWLPLAHPAAPSHVSGLLSGVMTKVAVYAFVRIVFDLLGDPAWWWSMVVLALAGITCVMGVLYALMQHDLKTAARLSHGREYRHHLHRPWACARISGLRSRLGGRARFHCGAPARAQPLPVQEPPVPRLRGRADRHRRTEHGASRRPHSSHAADGLHLPRWLCGHLGAAAAQWLRLRMADLPSHLAKPTACLMGPEISDPCGRCPARSIGGACRCLLRQGLRHHLSRSAAH
jgi:hypothetical protein